MNHPTAARSQAQPTLTPVESSLREREPCNILRMQAVTTKTGLGRSTIYRLIAEQRFPRQVVLSARAVGWYEIDVDDWNRSRRTAQTSTPSV